MVFRTKRSKYYSIEELKSLYNVNERDLAMWKGTNGGGLKLELEKQGKTRWLDIGCGGNLEDNFYYIDTFPEEVIKKPGRYFRLDITNAQKKDIDKLGKFDLVRMQHVFEHLSPEDGLKALNTIADLLKPGGYILITTPDLRKWIHLFLAGKVKENFPWALRRVKEDSPDSFFFSVFAHSMPYEPHKWCYDSDGLIYQLKQTGKYENIRELKLDDILSNVPFTHNRPDEDVCVIANLNGSTS
jgi:predicted SAM-dependent methyltransferase